ncbi:Utp14 protein-domain-containing protein [Daedaleopsis nitida]|nr:Utp14 protein-domain-containing protein [Daedaleopsis nitida]
MVKGRAPGKVSKSRPLRKAANALGYAKRQTLKSKTLGSQLSDVYEYQQEKVRRAKIKPLLEKDDTAGLRGGESGSEDEEGTMGNRRERRPRLVGENDDDDGIGEDEDEEIDSDGAFEESDEEDFAGSKFSRKSTSNSKSRNKAQRAVRFAEVDLDEDQAETDANDDEQMSEATDEEDEEEEEGDPSEFIDVLDVLDGRGEPETGDDMSGIKKDKPRTQPTREELEEVDEDEDMDGSSSSEAEEDSEQENETGRISASEDEDGEEGESALQDLETFVSGLDASSKRKAPDDGGHDSEPQRARKRRLLRERTEAGAENEFAATSGGGKLNLDDLLAPLEGQSSNLLSLKKSAKVLASTSGKIKTLSAPLPQRTAERLDREAAYEQTKEEVDKWKATMQRIQEAEHLSFPLQAEPKSRTSNLQLAAQFKPTTELESAVDKLLKSAKMREDEIAQTESLKMNHLSVEEVSARRAELAKMRDLMFRAEAKAKRIAKIKSKTYRRIRKKERARLAEKLGEGSDDDLDDEEARMKQEIQRARERATLRHKNTGKWAKAMRERGELDEDQRRDINEMLDRGEKLRRKIRGEDEGDSDEDSEDESAGEEGEEGISRIKAKAFDELAALDADEPELSAGKKGKSIFEMKFMKDAMVREQRKAHEIADDFIRELGGGDPDDEEESPQGDEQTQHVAIQRTGGRVVYRPGALTPGVRTVGSLASDTSSVTLKSTDLPPEAQAENSVSPPGSPVSQRAVPAPTADLNPWLVQASSSSKAQTKHEVAVSKTSAAAEKSKNKLRKRAQKRLEEKEKAQEDAAVDISLSTVMTLSAPAKAGEPSNSAATPAPSTSSSSKNAKQPEVRESGADEDESDSDANSELEEQERLTALKGKRKAKAKVNGVKAFEQRDLVALAFAGDNVVQDFAEAKRREMAEDAPKEIDTTLPGWGSWGGNGAKKAPPKPHLVKKVAGLDPKSRKDYNKAHVIISEKRDKKAAKYLVKDLPYPYTSKAQFERSMEVPLGTEWNTRLGFQRATLPKVVTKMGTLITPLEKQHS